MTGEQTFEQEFLQICAAEGPLSERLREVTRIIQKYDAPFADAYEELVSQLNIAEAGRNAPTIGDAFPDFLLPGSDGRLVGREDLLDAGPLVISFNRGHWCDYCDVELRAFGKALAEIARHGGRVVAIMPDKLQFIKQVREKTGNTFDILCDMDNALALELQLAIWLGDKVKKLLAGIGIDLAKSQGNDAWFVPIPATFVVAKDGIIAARYVDPDFRKRMDIDEIIAALKRASS